MERPSETGMTLLGKGGIRTGTAAAGSRRQRARPGLRFRAALALCAALCVPRAAAQGYAGTLSVANLDAEALPYDRAVGLDSYTIHSFIGKKPDIAGYTAADDVDFYLRLGREYIGDLYESFHESLAGRPAAQRYFRRFFFEDRAGRDGPGECGCGHGCPGYRDDCGRDLDLTVGTVSASCAPILSDIMGHLPYAKDREAFVLCYQALANEAYKEGLGDHDEAPPHLTEKYSRERASIAGRWAKSDNLKSINYERDMDQRGGLQTANHLDILLYRALDRMNADLNNELTVEDLRRVISIAWTTGSLEAMHDYVRGVLGHRDCAMRAAIPAALQEAAASR